MFPRATGPSTFEIAPHATVSYNRDLFHPSYRIKPEMQTPEGVDIQTFRSNRHDYIEVDVTASRTENLQNMRDYFGSAFAPGKQRDEFDPTRVGAFLTGVGYGINAAIYAAQFGRK